jgi:hypothetical protein
LANERELGIKITANGNQASAAFAKLKSDLASAGVVFDKMNAMAQASALASVGLTQALITQSNALTASGAAANAAVAGLTAVTGAIKTNIGALEAQTRALQERDAAVAATARASVRTPTAFYPGSMTEGMAIPTAATFQYRAMKQAEAEAIALEKARASVVRTQSGAEFWAENARRQGMGNGPLSAQGSASAFSSMFRGEDAKAEVAANRARLQTSSAQSFANQSTIYSLVATTNAWAEALKTTGNNAENAARKVDGLYNKGSLIQRTLQESLSLNAGVGQSSGISQADVEAAFGGGGSSRRSSAGRGVAGNEMRHAYSLFDEGARGQTGQMVATLGAALKDAGLGAATLATSFGAFMAVAAGGELLRVTSQMGKWAETSIAAAQATGMSVSQYTQIQGAMQLTGMKAESADASLRHFAQQLATAASDPASKAATAFHNLGISQQEIRAHSDDVSGALTMTIDRLSTYGNSAQKADAQQELLGRGSEKLGSSVDRGGESFEKAKAKAQDMGLTLNDQTAEALAKTGEKLDTLELKASGDFKKGFVEWLPEINSVIEGLDKTSTVLGKILGAAGKISSFSWKPMAHLAGDFVSGVGMLAGSQPEDKGNGGLNSISAVTMPKLMMGNEGAKVGIDDKGFEATFKAAKESISAGLKQMELQVEEAKKAKIEADQAQAARSREIRADIKITLDSAAADLRQVEQYYAQQLKTIRDSKAAFDAGQANMSGGAAKFDALAGGKPENDIGNLKAQAQAVVQQAQAQISALQQIASSAGASDEVRIEAEKEIAATVVSTKEKVVDLYNAAGKGAKDSANVFAAAMQEAFGKLDGQVNQFATSLLDAVIAPKQELIKAGLTTIKVNLEGQEIRSAAQKIFMSLANDFVSSVTSGLSQLAAGALGGKAGQGLGGLLADTISGGKGAGQAADFGATTANLTSFNAALTTATATLTGHATSVTTDAAATTTSSAAKLTDTASTTTHAATTAADTGGIFTHISATASDTIGFLEHAAEVIYDTGAEAVHAAMSLFGFSGGGVVPSAAGGMVVGGGLRGGGMISILHPKEMVLPAHLSQGVQAMINHGNAGAGNGGVNSATMNYSPTINMQGGKMSRSDFNTMLNSQSSSMIGEARNLVRRGWRP